MPSQELAALEHELSLALQSQSYQRTVEARLQLSHYCRRKYRGALRSVRMLIADSRGVVGLHLNGDEALWHELADDWLADFYDASELLDKGY